MIRGIDGIILTSENAKNLAAFYKEKVGLSEPQEYEMGEEGQSIFIFSSETGPDLTIMDHSEVKGNNTMPPRFMINFEVDAIDPEVEKLKDNEVNVIRDKYHIEGYGWVATFEDADGNYFQLVQVRPMDGEES